MSAEERLNSRIFVYDSDNILRGGFALKEDRINFGYQLDGHNQRRLTRDTLKMLLSYSKLPETAARLALFDPKTTLAYLKDCREHQRPPRWDTFIALVQDNYTPSPIRGDHVVSLGAQRDNGVRPLTLRTPKPPRPHHRRR